MKAFHNDNFIKIAIVFMFCYYGYAIIKAPIVASILIVILATAYFFIIRMIRKNSIRHQFFFTCSLVQFRNIVPGIADQKIMIWLMGNLNHYSRKLSESNSLLDDLNTLQSFRLSVLEFSYNEIFYNQIIELSFKLENIVRKKYLFYDLKIYFYNYKNRRRFKNRINALIND